MTRNQPAKKPGRKPAPEGTKKIAIEVYLRPELVDTLNRLAASEALRTGRQRRRNAIIERLIEQGLIAELSPFSPAGQPAESGAKAAGSE